MFQDGEIADDDFVQRGFAKQPIQSRKQLFFQFDQVRIGKAMAGQARFSNGKTEYMRQHLCTKAKAVTPKPCAEADHVLCLHS